MVRRDQNLTGTVTPRGSVTVGASTALWLRWLSIATDHCALARAGRIHLHDTLIASGQPDTARELDASLVTIAAAASSVDAMYFYLRNDVTSSQRQSWGRTRRGGVVAETFKAAVGMNRPLLARDIRWLYSLRKRALHHEGEFRKPISHPYEGLKGFVTWEAGTYTVEAAERAVQTAFDLVPWLLRHPTFHGREDIWSRRVASLRTAFESS